MKGLKGYKYQYNLEQAFNSQIKPIYFLKNILVPVTGALRVYAAKSRTLIREKRLDKNFNTVAAVALLPRNNEIIVASSSGNFSILNPNNLQVVLDFKIACTEILAIHTTASAPDNFYVSLITNDNVHQILLLSKNMKLVPNSKAKKHEAYKQLTEKSINLLNFMQFGKLFCFVVHASIPNCVIVSEIIDQFESSFQFSMVDFVSNKVEGIDFKNESVKKGFRTMATHPLDPIVALGNSDSEICLYKWTRSTKGQLSFSRNPELKSWHSSGVNALCFTPDGQNLLSGSKEGSLVSWRLGNNNNVVLPRLRGEICGIACSPDQLRYALRHTDGSVSLVNAVNMQLGSEIVGLSTTPSNFEPRYDSNTRALVLSGPQGFVNFLNLNNRAVKEVEIQPELNRVFDESYSPSVSVATVGKNQLAFATVLKCNKEDDFEDTMEPSLKFFALNYTTNKYALYAEIRNAHTSPVVDLKFIEDNQLVSLSQDGTFKMWLRDTVFNNGNEEFGWACSLSYKFEAKPISFQFSHDLSTIMLNYGTKLALLDGKDLTWIQYLTHPVADKIIQAHFLPNSTYLVATTMTHVLVFSMVTSLLAWEFPIESSPEFSPKLVVHSNGYFSVTNLTDPSGETSECELLTFDPKCDKPILQTHLPITPFYLLKVDNPSNQSSTQLEDLLLVEDNNTIWIQSTQHSASTTYKAEMEIIHDPDSTTETLNKVTEALERSRISHTPATGLNLGEQFNTNLKLQSHVAPPVSALLTDFVLAAMRPSSIISSSQPDLDGTKTQLLTKLELQPKNDTDPAIDLINESNLSINSKQVFNDLDAFRLGFRIKIDNESRV